MPGYRRVNLNLANELYSSPVNIEFLKVEEDYIGQLIYALKKLQHEVLAYYEHDQVLLEETDTFIKLCRKVVSTLSNYSTYFQEENKLIVKYFTLTKKRVYADLFKNNVKPIVDLIKILREQQNNAYVDVLMELIMERNLSPTNTYILTKKKLSNDFIKVNGMKYKIMLDKEFVNFGVFTDSIIFLGTPNYFDKKFSEIFYGKQIMFLGYSCFENRLIKSKAFSDFINQDYVIDTKYKDVTVGTGFSGLNFKETFLTSREKNLIEAVTVQFENIPLEEKIKAKLATISHNNHLFLPVEQEVNVIDRDSLKISQEKVNELSEGDLLIFRNQNASNLIREVANNLMDNNACRYRESLEKWKKRLRGNVKRKGIEKVSRILISRYGISVAKENNIKNWMGTHSIKPSCLSELLTAFKFNSQEKTEILHAADEIFSAHVSAGQQISQALMNELDKNLEIVIDENGFYTFESKEFEGASFNIEEIKSISEETYFILESETLKIIKG